MNNKINLPTLSNGESIYSAKMNIEQLVKAFKLLEKKYGKTKSSKKFMKLANEFLHCHLTNTSIIKKYEKLQQFMRENIESNEY